jgi:hypothetical protein
MLIRTISINYSSRLRGISRSLWCVSLLWLRVGRSRLRRIILLRSRSISLRRNWRLIALWCSWLLSYCLPAGAVTLSVVASLILA